MWLIYNSINYRRNVVGLEAVAGYSNAIVLFFMQFTLSPAEALCFVMVQSGQRKAAGSMCWATVENIAKL